MCNAPRMRTIQQCADYFKQEDPETKATYWRIRNLVLRDDVPSIRTGKAKKTRLVNLDLLIEYFQNIGNGHPEPGKIRPIIISRKVGDT